MVNHLSCFKDHSHNVKASWLVSFLALGVTSCGRIPSPPVTCTSTQNPSLLPVLALCATTPQWMVYSASSWRPTPGPAARRATSLWGAGGQTPAAVRLSIIQHNILGRSPLGVWQRHKAQNCETNLWLVYYLNMWSLNPSTKGWKIRRYRLYSPLGLDRDTD